MVEHETQENSQYFINTNFPEQYEPPRDQTEIVAEVLEQAKEYPAWVGNYLKDNISILGDAIGLPSKRFRAVGESEDNGLNDEMGFLDTRFTPNSFSTVTIREVYSQDDPRWEQQNKGEQGYINTLYADTGVAVAGEFEPASKFLVESMYKITGACVTRDLDEGDPSGNVVRRGTYFGEPVTFLENHKRWSYGDSKYDTFSMKVVGSKIASEAENALSRRDTQQLADKLNITYVDAAQISRENNLDRTNIEAFYQLGASASEAIAGVTVEATPPETNEQTAEQTKRESKARGFARRLLTKIRERKQPKV